MTELSETVKVQMKDIQHLRVCLDSADAGPSHLDMVAAAPAAASDKAGSEVAKSAMMKLFEHVLRFGRRAAPNVPHVPSPALDVEMSNV